jgi:hypothetical protein
MGQPKLQKPLKQSQRLQTTHLCRHPVMLQRKPSPGCQLLRRLLSFLNGPLVSILPLVFDMCSFVALDPAALRQALNYLANGKVKGRNIRARRVR